MVPAPKDEWGPSVRDFYNSLPRSGQSQFYDESDWYTAHICCDLLNRVLYEGASGAVMGEATKLMRDLMVTEGARRRAHLELERPEGFQLKDPHGVLSAVADYRKNIAG